MDEKLSGEYVLKCTNGAYSTPFTESSIVTHYGEGDTALESGKPHRCISTQVATEQHGFTASHDIMQHFSVTSTLTPVSVDL